MPRSKARREPPVNPREWSKADIFLTLMGFGIILMALGTTWKQALVIGIVTGWVTMLTAMFMHPPYNDG